MLAASDGILQCMYCERMHLLKLKTDLMNLVKM